MNKTITLLILTVVLFSCTAKKVEKLPNSNSFIKYTYPYYKYSPDEILKVKQEVLLKRKSLNKKHSVKWSFAGPVNIGGRITDLEFHPTKRYTIYAGSATGGLFKSDDNGKSWLPIFDSQPTLSIGDFAINEENPDEIIVGTGEANGGHNNYSGLGIFKTTDGGKTWRNTGLENSSTIGRVLYHPTNKKIIYVAATGSYFTKNTERGVYKSVDGGETWNKVLFISDSTGAIDLCISKKNPDILFAAMWERIRPARKASAVHLYGKSSGIYKSVDGGNTWKHLTNGLPDSEVKKVGRIGLTISKNDILYALYNDGSYITGLYRSDDLGETWEFCSTTQSNGFSWYFGQVRVDPLDDNIVYVLDVSLMKYNYLNKKWTYFGNSNTHVDFHAMAFNPIVKNTYICGNDGGINISYDNGNYWEPSPELPVTQFYELGLDFQNPERLYGGTQDNNTIRTKTGSLSDWEAIWGGDGFYVIVDPRNPKKIYAESQYGNLYSTSGLIDDLDFASATYGIDDSDPKNWSTPVVMDPNNPDILYYGTDKVYKTVNGAKNWSKFSEVLVGYENLIDSKLNTITTIDVAPSNSNIIYVGTAGGKVWVYKDDTWQNITNNLPVRWVTRIKADPRDESKVYVTFSGLKWKDPESHIFMSENYGMDWIDISSDLPDSPINALAIDIEVNKRVYVGNDIGVWYTENDGQSWNELDSGLPIVPVYDLKIHPATNELVAATHGRGIYKANLNNFSSVTENLTNPVNFKLFANYPNPFNPSTKINFFIGKRGKVEIKVFDTNGKIVRRLLEKEFQSGNHSIIWNGKDDNGKHVSSGVYFYRMVFNGKAETKKMILVK